MKAKRFYASLGYLLFVLLIFISTFVPAHAQQPIKLRSYYAASPTSGQGLLYQEWFKKVEKATNNRVEFVFFPSAILGPIAEAFNMVKSGAVDCGTIVLGFHPGQFPLSEVVQLPFLNFQSAAVASRVYWGLYEKFPEFRAEYSGVKLLMPYCDAPTPIGAIRPIRKLEDLKGLRIRAIAGSPTEMLKALGGTPVLIAPVDIYTSMERKVIDGWMWSWEGAIGNRLAEVTNYYTSANTYQPALIYIMNLNTWNKLPTDIQKILENYIGSAGSEYIGKGMDRSNEAEKAKVQAMKGKTIIDLSPEETKRWKEACKPVWDKWLASVEAKGLPGKAVLDEAQRLSEKFLAEHKK